MFHSNAIVNVPAKKLPDPHAAQIAQDIKNLGAVAYNFMLPETHALRYVVGQDERIIGIVFGRYRIENQSQAGRGALVATNKRVFLLDKKPLFVKCDELAYWAVSGVTFSRSGLMAAVTVHSKLGDIIVRTFNKKCVSIFVQSVEAKVFEMNQKGVGDDHTAEKWSV